MCNRPSRCGPAGWAADAAVTAMRICYVSRHREAKQDPHLAPRDGDRVMLARSSEAVGLVCQVICQLMGTVSVGWRL